MIYLRQFGLDVLEPGFEFIENSAYLLAYVVYSVHVLVSSEKWQSLVIRPHILVMVYGKICGFIVQSVSFTIFYAFENHSYLKC